VGEAEPVGTIQVLTYHRFENREKPSGTVVSPATFAAQMRWLAEHQMKVMKLGDVPQAANTGDITGQSVAITADDGWRSVFTEMFPVIQRHAFPITLFINPPMIGRGGAFLTWPMVAEMRASGLVDIQAHTLSHPNFNEERRKRAPADYAAFIRHEIADCRTTLEDKLSAKVDSIAWPFGIHAPELEAAAQDAGYTAAYALGSRPVTAEAPNFALPRAQIYEPDGTARFGWMAEGHSRKLSSNNMS
jgi:peptidoglycan/xylan/chitin deacetylase (PgdA/CDA1 family)